MSETKNIKMTDGPILSAVIRYSLPIVFAGMLQTLFNAADLAVVGHFAGSAATAAVGATGSTISLIVNTVMGLAVGVNVVLARSLGAGDRENSKRTVHTAIAVSVIAGIAVMIVGILISRPAMVYTRCPQDALEQAVQYMIIYFAGSPAIFVYNFGSAILRTKGDTKHPLYYLTAAGVLNIFLNLIFVIVFRMAAAGVALATTLTQYLAAFLTIRCLMRQDDECRFVLRETHIWKSQLIGIIKYGLPSGITQAMYSISNIQIQSAISGQARLQETRLPQTSRASFPPVSRRSMRRRSPLPGRTSERETKSVLRRSCLSALPFRWHFRLSRDLRCFSSAGS